MKKSKVSPSGKADTDLLRKAKTRLFLLHTTILCYEVPSKLWSLRLLVDCSKNVAAYISNSAIGYELFANFVPQYALKEI
jgi:hypothetical protein